MGVSESDELVTDLFDQHAAELLRYLVRRVGAGVAEDLLSQTFLVAWERWAHYDPARGIPKAWLYGIAANLLRRHRRDELRQWRVYSGIPAGAEGPDPAEIAVDRVAASARQRALATAVADLNPGDREVLLLFAWADLGYAEIAAALGIPVGTVRSRLNRARRRLREQLTDAPESKEALT